MKAWINTHWGTRNIRPSDVQYLPNNYYLFFFDDPVEALQVIGHGQWLIKNTPISVFKWYEGFNPRGDKPSKVPVWVDFPNLPVEYYPWLKELRSYLGSVLGQKSRGGFNPKWDPQLLVEIDLNKELIFEIPIKDSEGNWLHSQIVTYKNLPNACFHCNNMGHHIKHCPDLNAKDPGPENKEDNQQGFQQVSRRNSMKPPKNGKPPHPNGNSFKVLLEDVFDPFNHTVQPEDNANQDPQEDLPIKNPQAQAHPVPAFSTGKSLDDQFSHMPNSPNDTHKNGELSSSSVESDKGFKPPPMFGQGVSAAQRFVHSASFPFVKEKKGMHADSSCGFRVVLSLHVTACNKRCSGLNVMLWVMAEEGENSHIEIGLEQENVDEGMHCPLARLYEVLWKILVQLRGDRSPIDQTFRSQISEMMSFLQASGGQPSLEAHIATLEQYVLDLAEQISELFVPYGYEFLACWNAIKDHHVAGDTLSCAGCLGQTVAEHGKRQKMLCLQVEVESGSINSRRAMKMLCLQLSRARRWGCMETPSYLRKK
ncbi:hypothetical protein L7F22_062115 [Adiantum nelumboides]|nr:hypothetical protein [Adiantum nelumboides]